jgi:hypothetical protein
MSCDEQNRFEIVLRSLGARDATINFLHNQSVKEVLHLLSIQEDDITSWKHVIAVYWPLNARFFGVTLEPMSTPASATMITAFLPTGT